jgi:hypothetical protein
MSGWRPKLFLVVLVTQLAACASMQTVDVGRAMRDAPPRGVAIGSLVEVRTLDGRHLEFRVTEVAPQGLGGKFGLVAWEDMERLRVEAPRRDRGNVASYILGALGVVAFIALIDSADTVRICSTPPCE